MTKVYFISGLGADKRIFKNISLPNSFEKIFIEPPVPLKQDTLNKVYQDIVNQYNIKSSDIVIGDSIGGMMAIEIAKLIGLHKVIITSSIKSKNEAPAYFKLARRLPVYNLISGNIATKMGFMVKLMFKGIKPEDVSLFKSMLSSSSPQFLKWGAQAAVNWDNEIIPPNLYHIIGDKDQVFPYKNIVNPTAVIKGGTHIMVFDRAEEINILLADILSQ